MRWFEFFDSLCLDVAPSAHNETGNTAVPQLIAGLNATATHTKLAVCGGSGACERQIHRRRREVEPLCRWIANLRLQNEHHPLQAVELYDVESGIVRQFLVAMKQCGIPHVTLHSTEFLPVRWLMDFCRENSTLKVLNLYKINFTDEIVADPIGGSAATTLNLDKLILDQISFTTSFAATNFAHMFAHISVSALGLGALQDEEYYEFKMPSVEQLNLSGGCGIKHLQAALDAGMSTVTSLTVAFMNRNDKNETTKKLKPLTRMIRGAVKLHSLTIHNHSSSNPLGQFFQALDACASVTEIHVNNDPNLHDFSRYQVQRLRQITARNSKLEQFVANPSTFLNAKLLTLMHKFDKCPTGLYLLTRRLPEVFSFEKGNMLFPSMEPRKSRNLSQTD